LPNTDNMANRFSFDKNTRHFIAFLGIIAFCWFLGAYFHFDEDSFQKFLSKFPVSLSSFVFVFLYVLVTLLSWLAKEILKPIGAVLFGAYLSTFLIWMAETINAIIVFGLSRKLGRGFVEKILGAKLEKIEDCVGSSGFWGLLALRAVPLVSFQILDLMAGLSKISWKKYFLIVLLGSPLRIFWIQFILAGVGTAFLKDSTVLIDYLSKNSFIFILSFIYTMAAIGLAVKIKKIGGKRKRQYDENDGQSK